MNDEKSVARQPLTSRFERVAAEHETHAALVREGRTLTYGELNRRANRFARVLWARGVEPSDLVAVSLDRSFEAFVVLLGILKAGCAYVPLDPKLPTVRRLAVVRDCEPRFLAVTDRELLLDEFRGETVATWEIGAEMESASDENPKIEAETADVACVLYTSGSTGTPKGVVVPGRAILHFARWMWTAYPFRDDDVALLHRSYMHMAATWDYFGPLLGGIPSALIPGHRTSDPATLIRACAEHGVTYVSGSPGFWRVVIDHSRPLLDRWRTLRVGTTSGEQLPAGVAADFQRVFPRARLLNVYGVTEAVRPVAFETGGIAGDELRVPIGSPVPEVAVHVLDEDLAPVPDGEVGELCFAGPCLAQGYFRRPELTAQRFVPNPFDDGWPRLFRSGDLGLLRDDRVFELVGRRDHQVQVRGFRVELEDVEAALHQSPSVRRAAVVTRQDHGGDQRLTAFVLPVDGAHPPAVELRAFLEARLPDHMIPASFVVVKELPLTASGKIDRVGLAALDIPSAPRASVAPEPDRSATELALARIWANVIGVSDIGGGQTFTEVGGHSLMAMQIASRIYDAFAVEVPLEAFFPNPTLHAMSTLIDELRAGETAAVGR